MNCCKKHYCPICMEEKICGIKCKICTDTKVCSTCITKLCEEGIINKCPVCREENWKEDKSFTKIFPSIKNCKNIIKPQHHLKYCNNNSESLCYTQYDCILSILFTIKLFILIILSIIIIYIIGLIVLLIFSSEYSNNNNKTFAQYLLPFMIGIISVCGCAGLTKFCCMYSDDYD